MIPVQTYPPQQYPPQQYPPQQQVILVQQPMMNDYQQQLLQIQRQQQMALLQKVQFDVPQNWTNETTHLKFSQQVCCFGKTTIFTQTQNFGRIDFYRGQCKLACFSCKQSCLCYDHVEIPYYFQNNPSQACPIEIEMCCLKTALIRYKGTVIGKVELLITGICATSPRVVVKPIDESKSPMVLIPISSCSNKLDACSGYACKYPRIINVERNGSSYTRITNNFEPNPCCTMPCSEQNAFYARGDVSFEPTMKDDEKILLVCGWIIQQAFMSRIL
ncbi:hypothetical protein ABPG74_006239 [Tetrahymena malaccensis]